jgi:hypothetical protein
MEEVEICIKQGLTKISFLIPKSMDIITAKGLNAQMSSFIRILDNNYIEKHNDDKTIQKNIEKHNDDKTIQKNIEKHNDDKTIQKNIEKRKKYSLKFNDKEKKIFLKYLEDNGIEATMKEYNLTKKAIYNRRYSYLSIL